MYTSCPSVPWNFPQVSSNWWTGDTHDYPRLGNLTCLTRVPLSSAFKAITSMQYQLLRRRNHSCCARLNSNDKSKQAKDYGGCNNPSSSHSKILRSISRQLCSLSSRVLPSGCGSDLPRCLRAIPQARRFDRIATVFMLGRIRFA